MIDENRLKRLKIRSWRRGTKEMDLILGNFADRFGSSLSEEDLTALEALMDENDVEIYAWITGKEPPDRHEYMVNVLRNSSH